MAPAVYLPTLDGSGNLTISPESAANDNLMLTLSGGTYILTDLSGQLFDTPTGAGASQISGGGTNSIFVASSAINSISIDLGSNSNVFTLGDSGGAAAAALSVNAGTSSSSDEVNITGLWEDSGNLSFIASAILEPSPGALTTIGTLTTNSVIATTLTGANSIGALNASNGAGGNISVNNVGVVMVMSIAQSGGGMVLLSGGTFAAGNSTAFANAGSLNISGTLDLNGNSTTLGNLTGNGTITDSGGTATLTVTGGGNFDGTITGANLSLTVDGGELTLGGSNTYGGATTVSAGTLQLGNQLLSGTVANYAFNNPADLGQDSSGLGNNLVSMGDPQYSATGPTGNAVYLDGSSSFTSAVFPNGVPTGNSAYTVAAWIDSNGNNSAASWIGWGIDSLDETNSFRMGGPDYVDNYWYSNDFTVNLGESIDDDWHFVVFTYDPSLSSNQQAMYLDGTLAGTRTATGYDAAATAFIVGSDPLGEDFTGYLGQVTVLNRAISTTEVQTLMMDSESGSASNVLPAGTLLSIASGAMLDLNGVSQEVGGLSGGGNITNSSAGAATLTVNTAGSSTFSGNIGGAISLTMSGGGTLTLTGSNMYTGTTTISGSTLRAGSPGAIGGGALIDNGLLDLDGNNVTVGSLAGSGTVDNTSGSGTYTLTVGGDNTNTTFSGILQDTSGSLALTKVGSGTLTLTNCNSTYSGDLTIDAGTITTNATHSDTVAHSALGRPDLARSIIVNAGATLIFGGADILEDASATLAATLIIDGTVTNTGNFFNRLGPVEFDGGTLNDVGGASSGVQAWGFSGTVTVTGNTASAITGSGTYDGIHLNANTTFDVSSVTNGNGPDLTISVPLADQTVNQGNAAGGLTKTGAGVLLLSGANTYTGTTTISDGTIDLEGTLTASSAVTVQNGGMLAGSGSANGAVTVQSGGSISPSAPGNTIGLLTVGSLALDTGANFDVYVNGTSPSVPDRLYVASTINLDADGGAGANLNIVLNIAPAPGDQFTILEDTSSYSPQGTFAGLAQGAVVMASFGGQQYAFSINYMGTAVVLTAVGTTTTISAPAIIYGSNGAVTVTVTSNGGTPTGYVTLSVDGVAEGMQGLSNGSTTYVIPGLHVGNHTLTATYVPGGDLPASSANGTLTVTPFALTVNIGIDSQTYGSPANLGADFGTTINTGVNGENLDISYNSTGDSAAAHVGDYAITANVANGTGQASDYSVTYTDGTLSVTPYAFNYTIGSDSQTYGSPANLTADLGTTINTGVNGENLDITYSSTGDSATAHVGGYYDIVGALANGTGMASDYFVTLTLGTLTVTPFAFTVNIGNDSQTYGSPANLAADLGAGIYTGVNGETLAITYSSTGNTAAAHVGSYAITAVLGNGIGMLSDYVVTLTNGTLTVTPYAFSYTIGNDSHTYGSSNNLSADLGTTITTGVNGQSLGISYSSIGASTTAHAASYAITATLSNDTGLLSDYVVTLNNGTLTVNPFTFSYTIGNDSQTYGSPANLAGDLPTTISTGLYKQTLDVIYSSAGQTTTANVGSYAITAALANGTGLASDYNVTFTNGTLTVNPYAFSYTIGNDSRSFGSPAALSMDLPITIATGVNGENLAISYSSTGDTFTAHVGTYAITGTVANGTGLISDYVVTLADGVFTVNPLAVTLTSAGTGGVLTAAVAGQAFTIQVGAFQPSFIASQSSFIATIDWGDGTTSAGVITSNGAGGFNVTGTHTYTAEETVPVALSVTQLASGAVYQVGVGSAVVLIGGQSQQVQSFSFGSLPPGGGTVVVTTTDVAATFVLPDGSPASGTLSLANYGAPPVSQNIVNAAFPATVMDVSGNTVPVFLSFFDVRATGVTPGATLTVTFQYNVTANGVPVLYFLDASTQKFHSVISGEPLVINKANHTVQVVFTNSSFPTIGGLGGTVFTVAVAAQPPSSTGTTNTLVTPLLASNANAAAFGQGLALQTNEGVSVTVVSRQDSSSSASALNVNISGGDAEGAVPITKKKEDGKLTDLDLDDDDDALDANSSDKASRKP